MHAVSALHIVSATGSKHDEDPVSSTEDPGSGEALQEVSITFVTLTYLGGVLLKERVLSL